MRVPGVAPLAGLARGCHPGPTLVVTLVGTLLVQSTGAPLRTTLVAALTILTGQLSIGWSNDWLDAARDASRADKPTATGVVAPTTLRTAASVALGITVLLSVTVSFPDGVWQLVLVAAGWLYNVGLKATLVSPVPYAVGFGALPVYALTVGGADVPWWAPVGGALLGLAAHFANVAPDVELDRSHGVNGLPQRVGTTISSALAFALLAVAGVVLVLQLDLASPAAAGAVGLVLVPPAVGLWLLARGRTDRAVFRLVMVAAVLDAALLVGAA